MQQHNLHSNTAAAVYEEHACEQKETQTQVFSYHNTILLARLLARYADMQIKAFVCMDLIFNRDHVWFQLDLFSRPNCPKGPGGRGRHFIDVVVVVIVAYVQSSIQFGRPFWQSMF